MRDALGDDVALLVDANSCYTPAKAIEVGRMLEQHGAGHFEEPCPYWELEWTREVTQTLALRVAALARSAGLACTPHSANHSLVMVFTLHLLGAIENAGPYVEFSIEPDEDYPWQAAMYEPRPQVVEGVVQVPAGPGWGVEISREWLSRSEHRISVLD